MPMGAKNGNAAFQRMMDWVLLDLDCADPFVDDLIISPSGDTEEDLIHNHMTYVCKVLDTLRERNHGKRTPFDGGSKLHPRMCP